MVFFFLLSELLFPNLVRQLRFLGTRGGQIGLGFAGQLLDSFDVSIFRSDCLLGCITEIFKFFRDTLLLQFRLQGDFAKFVSKKL